MTKTRRDPLVDDDLLDVAAQLFRQKGFAATTVRDIAASAGIHPGSLHYRYPSKDDLLAALTERGLQRAIAALEGVARSVTDPHARSRLAVRAHLRLLLYDDRAFVALYEWRSLSAAGRERARPLRRLYHELWDKVVGAMTGDGRLRSGLDPKLVRLVGLGAANWAAQWYEEGGTWSPDEIADLFWAVVVSGVMDERDRPSDLDEIFSRLSTGQASGRPAPVG